MSFLQKEFNITYAEACRNWWSTEKLIVPNHSNDKFPPLPAGDGDGLLSKRPTGHAKPRKTSSVILVDPQIECSNQADSTSRFSFANPLLLLAFLSEVINKSVISKKKNKSMDVFKIIAGAAGGKKRLPISTKDVWSPTRSNVFIGNIS